MFINNYLKITKVTSAVYKNVVKQFVSVALTKSNATAAIPPKIKNPWDL